MDRIRSDSSSLQRLIMASYVNFEPAHRRAACRCRVAERGARQAGRRAAPLSAERRAPS